MEYAIVSSSDSWDEEMLFLDIFGGNCYKNKYSLIDRATYIIFRCPQEVTMKKLFTAAVLSLTFALLTTPAYSIDEEALGSKVATGKTSTELLESFFSCVDASVTKYTLEMEVPKENLGNIAWGDCSEDYFAYEIVRSGEAGDKVTEADMDLVNCKGKFYTGYQVIQLLQKDLSRAFDIMKKNIEQTQ